MSNKRKSRPTKADLKFEIDTGTIARARGLAHGWSLPMVISCNDNPEGCCEHPREERETVVLTQIDELMGWLGLDDMVALGMAYLADLLPGGQAS